MAYFRCGVAPGHGSDGADLIVTCSQNFAGKTITCTDGSSYTKTQTCPSSSPYEVTFESIPVGTYTISGVISGQTFSTTKTITDFDAALNDIPEGSTVTPADDVQILLNCANIWDKAYTTISQLLADTTSLLAVISDNNAVDYLVRSTTWASTVVADSTAMTYIGADDYCAETLLADSTWCTAIINSTYFESVLNVKVPTMTSATTPSGEVIASDEYSSSFAGWKAFDGSTSGGWYSAGQASTSNPRYIGYIFTAKCMVKKFTITNRTNNNPEAVKTFKLQGTNDNGTTWEDVQSYSNSNNTSGATTSYNVTSNPKYDGYRLYITANYTSDVSYVAIAEIKIYARGVSS